MSVPLLIAFNSEAGVVRGVRAARDRGLAIIDVYAPYPVHGLSEAMDLPPSRLPRVCLALGVAGAASMAGFAFWTTAVAWPINIGGKPWHSWPAFMPPIFETMILCAAVGTALVFFVRSGLHFDRAPSPYVPRATDDRFVLAIDGRGVSDPGAIQQLFASFGGSQIEDQMAGAR